MENKKKSALILGQAGEIIEKMEPILIDEGYTCVKSSSIDDGLLKTSNQDFDFIVVDMDSMGLQSREFVSGLRDKEAKKNVKDKSNILVCAAAASVFNRYFTHFDNVKFIEMPLKEDEFRNKVKSFLGKSDVIFENTKQILKGEFLALEGSNGQEMFWILDGSFEIIKSTQDETETIIGEVNSGELVGEMSFLDDLPRSASIRAKVDSEVLVIPQTKFADVLDKQPRWFRSLMKTLSQRLRHSNEVNAEKDE